MQERPKEDIASFTNLNKIKLPNPINVFSKIVIISILVILLILIITPWQQTSKGFGYIIANDPSNRIQEINSPIGGRIKKWHVKDGSSVKKDDIIAEIVDNDPQIIERLSAERNAKRQKLQFAQEAANTAKINYERQNDLFKQGLSSRLEFEKAKIEHQKLSSSIATSSSELAESEIKLARQQNQVIYAPRGGVIFRTLAGNSSTVVKAGERIASFAPDLIDPVIELYVGGNDIPLIYEGRKVRIQFEGWPAIQFSGWPSLAIGTFEGTASSIDSSISENGKFRIIVKKEEGKNWPDQRFLRHGGRVYGWVLLNKVSLGYEIWRQVNSFPPEFDKKDVKSEQGKKK